MRESYRFLWLRSFHHPLAVRVTRQGRAARLEVIELSGAGGYEPGKILRHIDKRLPAGDLGRLEAALARADFWALPTHVPNQDGLDGAQWITEGRRGDAYRLVERWTPKDGSFRDLGLLFLRLADLDLPPMEIY